MVRATYSDHVRILNFYDVNVPKSKRLAKDAAEKLIGQKLCNCINAVGKNRRTSKRRKTRSKTRKYNKGAAIAICRNSVLRRKGVINHRFTCKKKKALVASKEGAMLMKIKKNDIRKGDARKNDRTRKKMNGGTNAMNTRQQIIDKNRNNNNVTLITDVKEKERIWNEHGYPSFMANKAFDDELSYGKKVSKYLGDMKYLIYKIEVGTQVKYDIYDIESCSNSNGDCEPFTVGDISTSDNPWARREKTTSPTSVSDDHSQNPQTGRKRKYLENW